MERDLSETERLVQLGGEDDEEALRELFSRHRKRLKRMVHLRLDRRLSGRVDDSDVVQEVYLKASKRLKEYLENPRVPFFIWLRGLTGQELVDLHRRHLGARARDARREVSIHQNSIPQATSAVLAAQLLGAYSTPSEKLLEAEMKARVQEALESMDPKDREVLVLRHFEQLTNTETSRELGIEESAASKRYIRALVKLKDILSNLPGGPTEL